MLNSSEKNRPQTTDDFNLLRNYAKKTLSEIIYEDLKGKILRGEISSSERLQEDNLAKDYKTSRTPIRDALRKLEQESIIEKLYYGGYEVKELTLEDIEEIFGIRGVLESYAAVLATSRITEGEILEMEDILAKSAEAIKNKDYDAFVELNTEFHACLYNASRSKHLLRILGNLWDDFYRYRKIIFRTKASMEDSFKGHKMMIRKMKEGDSQAVERLVRDHVNRALRDLKKELHKKGKSN